MLTVKQPYPDLDGGPAHVDALHWHQSIGYARQACARIFRDGGTAMDAVRAFGIATDQVSDWSKAVDAIANALVSYPHPVRRAA